MNNIEVLDCTLRDGGYYTNWDFSEDLVTRYLQALDALGVSLVEIGFFSRISPRYKGPYYYSRANLIDRISLPQSTKLGVMINASEFQSFDTDDDIAAFLASLDDRLTFVRLACHHHELDMMHNVLPLLNKMGFDVGINLMKMESAQDDTLKTLVSLAVKHRVKWLYLADSFGSCTPSFIEKKFCRIRELGWSGCMGFHSHDNCGLAMANVFGAVKGGATTIDSTILGMGRGPGNVKTEQLISALLLHENPARLPFDGFRNLYELIEEYFRPLQSTKKWGASIPYSVSALQKIHPSFGQEMIRQNYSPVSLIKALERIGEDGAVYNQGVLDEFAFNDLGECGSETDNLIALRAKLNGNKVIIVGSGENNCSPAQIKTLKAKGAYVIGLNIPKAVDPEICDLFAVSQPVRIDQVIDFVSTQVSKPILMPQVVAGSLKDDSCYVYRLGVSDTPVIEAQYCKLPCSLVIGYAVAFALSCSPTDIILVGASGLGLDPEEHRRTQTVLALLHRYSSDRAITLRTAGLNSFDLPEINIDILDEAR